MLSTASLKSGYLVATDEYPVTIYDTLEKAEDHIKFQREYMKSMCTWYIVKIKLSDWRTFKFDKVSQE